ncbi:MAG: hypothetical protein K2X11_10885 [Acetobacteraceae bacterium]|nr:hypothetical protein [Acetobacteraceae bacterium]
MNVWIEQHTSYDSGGHPDNRYTVNDDNSREWTDWDQANQRGDAWYWHREDVPGRIDHASTRMDNGQQVNVDFDQTGTQSWVQVTETYDIAANDAATRLTQSVDWDNGWRRDLAWDPYNHHAHQWIENAYDPLGRHSHHHVRWDNATQTNLDLDETGTEGWTAVTSSFRILPGEQAVLVWQKVEQDTGTRTETSFDPFWLHDWTAVEHGFDAQGRHVHEQFRYDSGWTLTTWYDPANANATQWVQDTHDPLGRHAQHNVRYDDGSQIHRDLDETNASPLAWVEDRFDAAGRHDHHHERRDDGTQRNTDYDETGGQAWSRREEEFHANGALGEVRTYNDNGSWSKTYFDSFGQNPWSKVTETYTAANALQEKTVVADSGTAISEIWDRNGDDWNYQWLSYDAAGRLAVHEVFADNGMWTKASYDTTNTAPYGEQTRYEVMAASNHVIMRVLDYESLQTWDWNNTKGAWFESFTGYRQNGSPEYSIAYYWQNGWVSDQKLNQAAVYTWNTFDNDFYDIFDDAFYNMDDAWNELDEYIDGYDFEPMFDSDWDDMDLW